MSVLLLVRPTEEGAAPPSPPPPTPPPTPPPPPPAPGVPAPLDTQILRYVPIGQISDLERLFITEQPRFLWPTNQNSNFGALRKALTDLPQLAVDQLSSLFAEMFVATADGYLSRWEEQVGLPRSPALSIVNRRGVVLSRLSKHPFTRTKRKEIVERYLGSTLGEAIQLTPEGLALAPEGIPLYSGYLSDVSQLYFITEDVTGFSYVVYIVAAATPDLVSLMRELTHFTPAGIEISIVFYTPGSGRRYGQYQYGDFKYGGDEA